MPEEDKSRPARPQLDNQLHSSHASGDAQLSGDGDLDDGKLISGRYRVDTEIGRGGMSVVYKALDIMLNRDVALKKLTSMQNDAAIARFQQEARAAAKLQSPHIVSVYDFGTESDGTPYLVMEYIDGAPFSDLIKRFHQIDWLTVVEIMEQVCEALAQAHAAGVIHRDIKPSNILVTTGTNLKYFSRVVDFGIARLEASEQSLTKTGEVFGSPLYMSPEQATGKKVDARSDIYSLGCVMFEALTGRPPFAGASSLETLMMHQTAPVPTIQSTSIPIAVIELVESMLEKDPTERPTSCTALIEQLRSIERDPSKQSTGPRNVLTKKNSRAQKINVMASVVALSVIAGIGLFALQHLHHPNAGKPSATTNGATDMPDPEVNSLLEQARSNFAEQNLQKARELADAATKRCETFGTRRQYEECLELVANFYSVEDALADPELLKRAEHDIREALKIVEQLDGRENSQYIIDLKILATILKYEKQGQNSFGLFKDCLVLMKKAKIENLYLEASIHQDLANAYFDRGQIGAANNEFDLCIKLYNKFNANIREAAIALHQWSNIFSTQKDYNTALVKIDESIAIWKNLPAEQQRLGYPAALLGKARILRKLDRAPDELEPIYEEVLRHRPMPLQVLLAYKNLGDCNKERKQFDEAEKLYGKALAEVDKLPSAVQTKYRTDVLEAMSKNAKKAGNKQKQKEFGRRAEFEQMAVPQQ